MNKLSWFKNVIYVKLFKPDSFDVDNSLGQYPVKCFAHPRIHVYYGLCKWMVILISWTKVFMNRWFGCVKLRISTGKLCFLFAMLGRCIHTLVFGAWLLSFSCKYIWRNWDTSGLLNIWCTVIVMADAGSWERDSTATSGVGLDSLRPTEGSIADIVKTLH
jgi:hypothetical protein